jgi:TonB family protein
MRTFQLCSIVLFFCFANLICLQAQETSPLLAVTAPKSTTPKAKRPTGASSRASFDNLGNYIHKHLKYPELASYHSIEGTVRILVLISPEGKITKAEVVKSLGFGCDEAALAVVNQMPQWSPATRYGINVADKRMLEFNFRLR